MAKAKKQEKRVEDKACRKGETGSKTAAATTPSPTACIVPGGDPMSQKLFYCPTGWFSDR